MLRIFSVRLLGIRQGVSLFAFIIFALAGFAAAQDTRTVTEPKIPPVCTRLGAHLVRSGSSLSEADESRLDTDRIQKALDACGAGRAVELAPGSAGNAASAAQPSAAQLSGADAFLSGPLDLREGVTLLIDRGVTLFASRDPKVYEITSPDAKPGEPGRCGTSMPRPASFPTFTMGGARPHGGCRALISVSDARNTGVVGEGTVDGRGYARLRGKDYSWWELARRAQPHDDIYWSVKLIVANHADGFTLYKIHLVNSPNYHVTIGKTNGFTAWGVHLQTPVDKSLDARNTDGIDPGTSQNITVAHSWIDNGDDNIAIKQGVSHMSVLDNHFYSGHGMSIGSETVLGQSYLLVDGLVENHTTSGIRIKSNVKRGGPVHDLVYENICMKDVPIPIAISPYYTNQTVEPFTNPNYTGEQIPDYKSITLRNIFSETPGDVLIAGLDEAHRTQITLDNVFIRGIQPSQVHLDFADITTKDKGANFPLRGQAVKVLTGGVAGSQSAVDPCASHFVPMQ